MMAKYVFDALRITDCACAVLRSASLPTASAPRARSRSMSRPAPSPGSAFALHGVVLALLLPVVALAMRG